MPDSLCLRLGFKDDGDEGASPPQTPGLIPQLEAQFHVNFRLPVSTVALYGERRRMLHPSECIAMPVEGALG